MLHNGRGNVLDQAALLIQRATLDSMNIDFWHRTPCYAEQHAEAAWLKSNPSGAGRPVSGPAPYLYRFWMMILTLLVTITNNNVRRLMCSDIGNLRMV